MNLSLEGTVFEDIPDSLLKCAFLHESGAFLHEETYYRYEFLGDALLDMVVSEILLEKYRLSPGVMTDIRKEMVENKACTRYMKEKGLEQYIVTGRGITVSDGMIANVFEALLGVLSTHLSQKGLTPIPYIREYLSSTWGFSTRIDILVRSKYGEMDVSPDGYYPWTKWSEGYIEEEGQRWRIRVSHPVLLSSQTRIEKKPYTDVSEYLLPFSVFKELSPTNRKSTLLSEIDFCLVKIPHVSSCNNDTHPMEKELLGMRDLVPSLSESKEKKMKIYIESILLEII